MRKTPRFSRQGMYRPSIRLGKHGHPMRDPEGHDDNTDGNSGTESKDSGTGDNNGQSFDYSKFWSGSGDENDNGPSGESTPKSDSSSGHQQQQQQEQTPAQKLVSDIQGLNFGNGIMTDDVIKELADGKTDTFHANLNKMGQTAVESAIRLMIPLMGQMREQIRNEFKDSVKGNNTTRDNEAALLKAIPSASDPKVRPNVDRIFNKALEHTKGDRESAISMTKDMLKLQSEILGNDLGIAPKTSGDNFGSGKIDWLSELAGR